MSGRLTKAELNKAECLCGIYMGKGKSVSYTLRKLIDSYKEQEKLLILAKEGLEYYQYLEPEGFKAKIILEQISHNTRDDLI